jgi:hypothetical protein
VVDYVGEVWCATVPSGAFVVRRNGLVSVSGNSGFPKSLDVSKAIDKGAGVWRGRSGDVVSGNSSMESPHRERTPKGEAVSDAAKQWEGWGTALKPAFEPVVVGRKPLGGTVVATVLAHGTGALNIDGCRVAGSRPDTTRGASVNQTSMGLLGAQGRIVDDGKGRWPANVLLSHAEGCRPVGTREVVTGTGVNRNRPEIPEPGAGTIGMLPDNRRAPDVSYGVDGRETVEAWECVPGCPVGELDRQSGGASRFFPTFRYEPKAPTSERPRVLSETPQQAIVQPSPKCARCGRQRVNVGTSACTCVSPEWVMETRDFVAHPTVKPVEVMRWLVRLVTLPGGLVLDPFAGSGTTAEACRVEGMRCVLVEREAAYLPLIAQRLARPTQSGLF